MADFQWVPTNSENCTAYRNTALRAGHENGGSTSLYVGRACYDGSLLPAKVNLDTQKAYVCKDGIEIEVSEFEMYCGSQLIWMRAENGSVPNGAVSAGTTCEGEEAFVGRARLGPCGEDIIIGKVLASQGACLVPFDGKEEAKTDYEVLVLVQ